MALLFDQEARVAEIELRASSTLRVTLIPTSEGDRMVSLRVWVDRASGKYSGPTKQGLFLPPIALEGLIVALKRAQKSLEENGAKV